MTSIEACISVVEEEEKVKAAAAHKEHSQSLQLLGALFTELNKQVVRSTFDHPHCDRDQNNVDLIVHRYGHQICKIVVGPDGGVILKDATSSIIHNDADRALLAVVRLLYADKRRRPHDNRTFEEIERHEKRWA